MSAYNWTFFKAAGVDLAQINSGEDIKHLAELDEKLWSVLACPTQGVHFDAKTLAFLDSDKDGRIRVKDILDATGWVSRALKNPAALPQGAPELSLADLNPDTPEGARLLATAQGVLAYIGKHGAEKIAADDLKTQVTLFANTRFNGDGVLPASSAGDDALQSVIRDILACTPEPAADLNGQPGITRAQLDAFVKGATELLAWKSKPETDPALMPLGDDTPAAVAAYSAVAAKIDDFFTRCRLVAYDTRAAGPLNRAENDYAPFSAAMLSNHSEELASFPLTKPQAHTTLPLAAGVNPYWAAALNTFRATTLAPFLGENKSLTEAQWEALKPRLQPHLAWQAAKPATTIDKLSAARIREILGRADDLRALFDEEDKGAVQTAAITELEKFLRYHQHLFRFVNNTVSFADFYDPNATEISRAGRLYIDKRACDMTVYVNDVAAHAALAANAKTCLVYCACSHPATGVKKNICAAVTSGFAETLWVGRNGLFVDRNGVEWDATVVSMVDNPISLKEAFWSPWKKLRKMIAEQFNKLLSEKQDALLNNATQSVAPPAGAPRPKLEGAALASSVAALGIAGAFIGVALTKLFAGVAALVKNLWILPVGVAVIILAVSLPSVIITFFKLRQRDFAPLLNASGWAVNNPIRITFKLGRRFTTEAALPPGAKRRHTDPYADKPVGRWLWFWGILIALLTALSIAAPYAWKQYQECKVEKTGLQSE